ncbi:MAG: hypothetical protein DHS20C14_07510 [Phycisphaeraceae bacterium]|nr:MAG: hypothetical protein DHS20C14_07510 [Phycisphaeraceae bacterium]
MHIPLGYPGGKKELRETITSLKRACKLVKQPDQPRDVDYWCVFPDRASAMQFMEQAAAAGFTSLKLLEPDDEDPEYQVLVVVRQPLQLDAIVKTEISMHRLAAPLGGTYDGWGTLSDDPD